MKETCQQERCSEAAALRIFWPSKPPTALCSEHAKHAYRVAAVMGIELPTVAIDTEEIKKALQAMARQVAVNCLRLCLHPAQSRLGVWERCDDCGSVRAEPPTGDGLWHPPSWSRLVEREFGAFWAPAKPE